VVAKSLTREDTGHGGKPARAGLYAVFITTGNYETFVPDSKSCGGRIIETKIALPSYNQFANDHAFFFQRDVELGRPQKRALTLCRRSPRSGISDSADPSAS
jgi:hypothetical protein